MKFEPINETNLLASPEQNPTIVLESMYNNYKNNYEQNSRLASEKRDHTHIQSLNRPHYQSRPYTSTNGIDITTPTRSTTLANGKPIAEYGTPSSLNLSSPPSFATSSQSETPYKKAQRGTPSSLYLSPLSSATSSQPATPRKKARRGTSSSLNISSSPSPATSSQPATPHRKARMGHAVNVQRIKPTANENDLKLIYTTFTKDRPILEVELPIWVPEPVQSSKQSSESNTTALRVVVQQRTKDVLSRSDIIPYMKKCSPTELNSVKRILKTCLTLDIVHPGKKEELFQWL